MLDVPKVPAEARAMTREHIYRVLRQGILSGQIPAGQRLIEESLAGSFDASRTPVREALQRLESDHLVVRSGRSRLVTNAITDRDRENLHVLRMAVDEAVARLVCKYSRPEDWKSVLGVIDVLETVEVRHGRSSPQFASAHLDVHMEINQVAFGAGSSYLGHPLLYVDVPTDDYVQQSCDSPADQHRNLVAELSSHDVDRAVAAAIRHAQRDTPAE